MQKKQLSAPSIFDARWERRALIWFAVEIALLALFSLVQLPPAYSARLISDYQSARQAATSLGVLYGAGYIYVHNLLVALAEFIPAVGLLFFLGSASVTGLVLGALNAFTGLPGILNFLSLFLLPHTWLELPAYALAVNEGMFLLLSASKANGTEPFSEELRRAARVLCIIIVELAFAAFFESGEIALSQANTLYPLLAWVPFAAILVLSIKVRASAKKRIRKQYSHKT